jgi:hypothetical protein
MCPLEELRGGVWTAFSGFRRSQILGVCTHDNKFSGYMKAGNFLTRYAIINFSRIVQHNKVIYLYIYL